jgi:hypothetical protein
MNQNATKEERLMVQVCELQRLLSDAEFARDRWRKSARRLYDAMRELVEDEGYPADAFCLELFVDTYRWENQS